MASPEVAARTIEAAAHGPVTEIAAVEPTARGVESAVAASEFPTAVETPSSVKAAAVESTAEVAAAPHVTGHRHAPAAEAAGHPAPHAAAVTAAEATAAPTAAAAVRPGGNGAEDEHRQHETGRRQRGTTMRRLAS